MNALSRFSAIMNPQNLIMIVSLIMRCIMRLLVFQCTPPPSPSPGAIAHQVTTRFMLGGSVTDFDAAAQVSIKTVLAREADVSMSAVTLTLTVGSVIVQADIVLATAEGATFAASQLSAGVLASSETLETALNTQFKADGVEATASVQAIVDAPEVVSTGDDSQGVGTSLLVGIVVSGVAAVLLGLLFGVCVMAVAEAAEEYRWCSRAIGRCHRRQ